MRYEQKELLLPLHVNTALIGLCIFTEQSLFCQMSLVLPLATTVALLTGVLYLISPFPVHWLLAESNIAILHCNRYSAEANSMDHSCSCCRETETTEKYVVLKCPGGHSVSHKYIYVESCSCQDTACSRPQSNELQNNEENDTGSLSRIKRAISFTSK